MHIRFDQIDGFTRVEDGNSYLILFRPEKYDAIYNIIRYVISLKTSIIYVFLVIMQISKLILIILYLLKKD